MLILTRRVGESLMIGDDVTITVLGVKGESGSDRRQGAKGSRGAPRLEILNRIEEAAAGDADEE